MGMKLITGFDFQELNLLRSLGVVLYIMLCGSPPFYGKTTQEILAAIKKGVYTLAHKPFLTCSIEVINCI